MIKCHSEEMFLNISEPKRIEVEDGNSKVGAIEGASVEVVEEQDREWENGIK